jgi:hypothetical protein
MLMIYLERAQWVGGLALVAAFLLTFWRSRWTYGLAAVCYGAGSLINVAWNTGTWVYFLAMTRGMDDAPDEGGFPVSAIIIPLGTPGYIIAAVILLSSRISQPRALYLGKILHLAIFPILFLFILNAAFGMPGPVFHELRWLVYGPLWFRIRELCPEKHHPMPGSQNPFLCRRNSHNPREQT